MPRGYYEHGLGIQIWILLHHREMVQVNVLDVFLLALLLTYLAYFSPTNVGAIEWNPLSSRLVQPPILVPRTIGRLDTMHI